MTNTARLWISRALSPYGNDEFGVVAVVAKTQDEAIAKASEKLALDQSNCVPRQGYAQALMDNLDAMSEVTDEVFIDWTPSERKRS